MPRRARSSERGAAVVDVVLVLLVLLPLVIGILQLALVLHVRNTLASAAAEGARHAAERARLVSDLGPFDAPDLRAYAGVAPVGDWAALNAEREHGEAPQGLLHPVPSLG